ncbi:hypothetical protein [Bacillus sp. 522_BSPC]|nr:hypothetical protein [uncultured Metabacillus sp.]
MCLVGVSVMIFAPRQ